MARNRLRASASQSQVSRSQAGSQFWGGLRAALLALAGALVLVACVGAPPEVSLDDPELVEGRSIYAKSCASCHGASGGGGVGRKLSGGAVVEAFPDVEDQIDLTATGQNNMPAFGDRLSPEQQRAVARYIREIL